MWWDSRGHDKASNTWMSWWGWVGNTCLTWFWSNKLINKLPLAFTGLCDRIVCVASWFCNREAAVGVQPVRHQQRRLHYQGGTFNKTFFISLKMCLCRCAVYASGSLQEMMAIMTSIYDMMGRYTLPTVREDSPFEHVEKFFQVCYLLRPPDPSLTLGIWINFHFMSAVFQKMDRNRDGVVTIDEFIETCQKVNSQTNW